jgi:hypothetical protein
MDPSPAGSNAARPFAVSVGDIFGARDGEIGGALEKIDHDLEVPFAEG